MQCKCKYFHMVDGKRVCVQCGKPAHPQGAIEDKVVNEHETKTIFPPESKRISRISNKRGK